MYVVNPAALEDTCVPRTKFACKENIYLFICYSFEVVFVATSARTHTPLFY